MASTTELTPAALHTSLPNIPAEWLRGRRWFSSKGRTITAITVADWGALPLDQPALLAIARVQYAAGDDEQFLLPLLASPDAQPVGVQVPPALTIDHHGTSWYVHDAFQFDSFRRLLLELLIAGTSLPLQGGQVVFRPEVALQHTPPPLTDIKLVTSEQSNSSIIYDRQVILKCFRRVVAGINPDVEVSRFLTTRAGFRHTPAMMGQIAYLSASGVEHSLGLLQNFIPNEGDAWEHTLVQLSRFFAAVQFRDRLPDAELLAETQRLAASQLTGIKQLGALTGGLHLALASYPQDQDFAPRPLELTQVTAWQAAIQTESETMLHELERRSDQLPAAERATVATLLAARDQIAARIVQLDTLSEAELVITRYHGDYHLGQVLVSEQGFLILDFEGEPLRSLSERRAYGSPLRDVAGMLRSLSYVAYAALTTTETRAVAVADLSEPDTQSQSQLAAWADAWEQCARQAFLDGYRNATRNAAFLPQQRDVFDNAVAVFELQKAMYELQYELNNRPDWLPIPLHGILRVI